MVVGGIPVNFGRNFKLGEGEHFVIEGDEYNTAFFDKGPKFLHYGANTLILNNIEFDHADIYENLEAIVSAFRAGVRQVAAEDVIIANGDDVNVTPLRGEAKARWFTFGMSEGCDIRAGDVQFTREGAEFTVWWEGKQWRRFRTTLSGQHNVLNAIANIAACRLLGLEEEEIQKGLETFKGIKRRMEVRGLERGVTVIDDFAHHPTAIETTLHGARARYPGSRIWGVFEPKSISSGRREFEEGYSKAFLEADHVIIGPIFHKERFVTRYGIEKMMSVPNIVESLAKNGVAAEHIETFDEIAERIGSQAQEGDVVIVMSSGAFGGIHEKILSALRG
jgi:UDP-N-acetylmuramate: L-alanyl-gamma-D-glutamyl-meso-diaminopimelate ligase